MLTFEMLFAVLQGLPSSNLDHLDKVWIWLCGNIQLAREKGSDPLSALKIAIQQAEYWQILAMKESFEKARAVMQLPGLSYRQKEALIALRVAGVASLAQLNRVLMQDRAHTHKRLAALVKKGLAVKFFRPNGVYYFAIPGRLESSVRSAAHQVVTDLMETLLADTDGKLHTLSAFSSMSRPATPATPATSATSATPATSATWQRLAKTDP